MFVLLALTLVLGDEITTPRTAPVAHSTYTHALSVATSTDTTLFAWSDARGIVISRDLPREAIVLSPAGTDPDVAAGRDGFLVTWTETNALFAMRLDAKGNPTSAATKLLEAGTGAPRVVHAGNAYHVLLAGRVNRVPATGALAAAPESIPNGAWTSIAARADSFALTGATNEWIHGWCSVCMMPVYTVKSWFGDRVTSSLERYYMQSSLPPSIGCNGSRCLAAWYDTREGVGLTPGGDAEFFLSTHTDPPQAADQTAPIAIAPYGDDFIIAWQERTLFGDSDIIAAAVPYANPSKITRFVIAATARNERRPSIGMLNDGRVVIAYEVVDTDGSTYLAMRTLGAPGRRRTF